MDDVENFGKNEVLIPSVLSRLGESVTVVAQRGALGGSATSETALAW